MYNNLYLIFDTVANNSFGGLIRVQNDEVARRSFYDALTAQDSPMLQHQADYELRRLGRIDETTGIIDPQDIPTVVARGQDWLDANKGN